MGLEVIGLGYLGYESPNHKAMLDYGPEVFGFGLDESRDYDVVRLTMDDRSAWRIAVHPGQTNRLAYAGLQVATKLLWEEGVEHLRRHGVEVTVGDDELEAARGCSGVAQFRDPSGWPYELCYGLEYDSGRWRPGRAHAGFRSAQYGVGHTVFATSDLDATRRFCDEVLEYKWYNHGLRKDMAAFYRTKRSDLSHVVAYVKNPQHTYGDTSLHLPHAGIYCETLDDVGIAYDIVQDRDPALIERTLGRHAQDPVISFYSDTPAGFTIEYIWAESLSIPDATYVEGASDRLSIWGHQLLRPRSNGR